MKILKYLYVNAKGEIAKIDDRFSPKGNEGTICLMVSATVPDALFDIPIYRINLELPDNPKGAVEPSLQTWLTSASETEEVSDCPEDIPF
jgi:hypothetical protein